MKQIFLIFRKDCHHFWPEILLSLVVAAAFVWAYPYQWTQWGDPILTGKRFALDLRHLQILADTITTLLPISWLILIARSVHDENLLGTRQFWLTRPYKWPRLLAAKTLFIGVFICLPFTLAQIALLHRAGFAATRFIPNLTYNAFLIASVIVLPCFALAAVTSSLLRIIGTLLSFAAIVAVFAFAATTINYSSDPSVSVPYSDRLSVPLILAICWAILFMQYSSRKLWLSRTLYVTLILSIAGVAISPFERTLLDYYYPGADNTVPPILISIPQNPAEGLTANLDQRNRVMLRIPMSLNGVPAGKEISPDDLRLTIETADHKSWPSPWQAIYSQNFTDTGGEYSSKGDWAAEIAVDRNFFNLATKQPVTLRLDFAFTELKAGQAAVTPYTPGRELQITGVGICRFANDWGGRADCKVPFHQPDFARLSVQMSPEPCGTADESPTENVWSSWVGSLNHDPSDIGLTPVWTTEVSTNRIHDADKGRSVLCPGAPITVTRYELFRRYQGATKFAEITLPQPSDNKLSRF